MTPDEQKKAFEAELYTWVGKEIAPPTPGLDLVNEAMIRHWCEVMGDTNPVYVDFDNNGRYEPPGIQGGP